MGSTWGASHDDVLPASGGLADILTTGTTESGLEFEFMRQIPLPGTAGCAETYGSAGGDTAYIDWTYGNFEFSPEDGEDTVVYEKPNLETLTIDWGDGSEEHEYTNEGHSHQLNGWESHTYDDNGYYSIHVTYTPIDGYSPVTHAFNYLVGDDESGFRRIR